MFVEVSPLEQATRTMLILKSKEQRRKKFWDIAQAVAYLVDEEGMTQVQIARRFDSTQPHISMYYRIATNLHPDLVEAVKDGTLGFRAALNASSLDEDKQEILASEERSARGKITVDMVQEQKGKKKADILLQTTDLHDEGPQGMWITGEAMETLMSTGELHTSWKGEAVTLNINCL